MKKLIFAAIIVFSMLSLTKANAQENVRKHNDKIEAYQRGVHLRNDRIYHKRMRRHEAQQRAYQQGVHRRNDRIYHKKMEEHGH